MSSSSDRADPIPISLVAHYVFCPRRAWLEAAGEETDTAQMAVGTAQHAVPDDPRRSRRDAVRAMDVASEDWGISGRCDTVHVQPDGSLEVVEHKATPVRREPTVTAAMRVQLALQRQALQDGGHVVSATGVWFTGHRMHVDVDLTDADVDEARRAVHATRSVVDAVEAPAPLEDDPRCSSCSHISVCLPDERRPGPVTRQVRVADPDSQVVHLSTFGARASLKQGRILVHRMGEQMASLPIERVQAVVVHGNVDLSGGVIRELLYRDIPLLWCSSRGRLVGWAASAHSPNGGPRARQAVASQVGRLDLASEFVSSKIAGQATLLRRRGGPAEVVAALRRLSRAASHARGLEDLLGIEGDAAARYFGHFTDMLTEGMREQVGTSFPGRARRPATDPVNAALNYAYSLVLADTVRAVMACGLDPQHGFLHSSGRNKPALALDLAEEFRAAIADSCVVGAFNNGELGARDFSNTLGSTVLRDRGRKALIAAYERRVCSAFMHPTFRYRLTWRRAMEVQARLILGVLDGSMPTYIGIRTR